MINYDDNVHSSQTKIKLTMSGKMFGIMTFLTVLSQLPQLVNAGYSSIISRSIWVVGFIVIILRNKKIIVSKRFIGALIMAFTVFGFSTIQFFLIKSSLFSTLSSCILLSIFILFVSVLSASRFGKNDLEFISKCYIFSSMIVALDLLFTTLRNANISDVIYAYASKNSAGVILFTGFVLTIVYGFKKRKTFNNVICIGIMLIFFLTILLLKTRAMIVCFPIVLILFIYFSPFDKKIKGTIIVISILGIMLLLNEQVYDIIINKIVFNNRNHTTEDISSGRFSQWLMLGKNLTDNWAIGDGKTEQESLILTALIQYGVFMGGYIILYSLWPLFYSIKKIKIVKNKHIFCLLCVSTAYFIDAIFEQLAPFGPGVRCFYLWLLFGIILSNNKLSEVEGNDS